MTSLSCLLANSSSTRTRWSQSCVRALLAHTKGTLAVLHAQRHRCPCSGKHALSTVGAALRESDLEENGQVTRGIYNQKSCYHSSLATLSVFRMFLAALEWLYTPPLKRALASLATCFAVSWAVYSRERCVASVLLPGWKRDQALQGVCT